MKKISMILMAMLVSLVSYAQIPVGSLTQVGNERADAQLHAPMVLQTVSGRHAKKLSGKAPERTITSVDDLVGKVIVASVYYDYSSEQGLYEDSPAMGGTAAQISKVDANTIKISGFVYGATEDITATIDWESGQITIPAGQLLYTNANYGPILMSNVESDGDFTGFFSDEGYIVINQIWFQLIGGDGPYAGYRLGGYNQSFISPVNGTMSYTYQGETVTNDVLLIQDDDDVSSVLIFNFADWETAIQAVLKGDKTFSIPTQLVGSSSNGDFYTYGLDEGESNLIALTGTGTETTLTFDSKFTAYASTGYWYGSHGPATITLTDGTKFVYPEAVSYPDPVTLPEGVVSSTYTIEADDMFWGEAEPYSADVQVAFDGANVYFQGLSAWLGSAWVKGTLADGKVSIPTTYLGSMDGLGVPMYFFFNEAEFNYDAATGLFTAHNFSTYAEYDLGDGELVQEDADLFENIVLTPAADDPATPAMPLITLFEESNYGYHVKFEIPLEDVNGNPIFPSKLSWQLFSRTNGRVEPFVFQADLYEYLNEDMATVPYNFSDYWDIDNTEAFLYGEGIENWKFVGIKTIYTGGGETNESEICWWDIAKSSLPGPLAIEDVSTSADRGASFDLQGRRVEGTLKKGLYIRDGKKFVVK